MSDAFTAKRGGLFIQLRAGDAPEYLGCTDLAAIAEPAGDQGLILCRDGSGDFKTVGQTQGAPGPVTTSVKTLVFPESNILDRIRKCPVNLFALQSTCGKINSFTSWKKGAIVHHARVNSRSLENIVMREADDPTMETLDFSGWNPVYRVRDVTVSRQSIAENVELTAIAACSDEVCAGDCGPAGEPGDSMFLGGVAPAGSPTDRADIWCTEDAGNNWTNLPGAAAHPFVAGQDIGAVGCFWIDKTTTRWIAVRASVAGEPLKIAYSDNAGASWTLVTIGAINTEGAAGAGALFVIDREHLWIATTEGNVYFSDDSGITWALQADAATAGGGNSLNAIAFADPDNGWAVGDTDTIIATTDGGDSWGAVVSPTSGDDVLTVAAFSKFRAIIGSDGGDLFQTWDAGVNWTAKAFVDQGTGEVRALAFLNELTGFMLHNSATPVGAVHRSIDGGHTWQKLPTPTNAGLDALVAVDVNKAFAVGKAQGGTSVVLKIAG